MLSFCLSLYILVILRLFDAIASLRLGEKLKPNSPSNYEILIAEIMRSQFRLRPLLKVVLTLINVFLMTHLHTFCRSSSM